MKKTKPKLRYRLGQGGVVYLVVMALLAAAAFYTQANLLFWALGLTLGALLVSFAWAWLSLRRVDVLRLLPAHCVAGEPLVVRYHISNRSRLPIFSMVLRENWGVGWNGWRDVGPVAADPPQLKGIPYGWVLHIGPNQTTQAEAPAWPTSRGKLQFDRVSLGTAFPFNVLHKIAIYPQEMVVTVYPPICRMNRRVLQSVAHADPGGGQLADQRGGDDEFYGLREYRPGDSLKTIDWKRTAHGGGMVAREYTQPSPPRMMVLLDLSDHEAAARAARSEDTPEQIAAVQHRWEEDAISLVASLICDAYLNGFQIGLGFKGVAGPMLPIHHSLPHRTKMLETLAGLDLSTSRDPGEGTLTTAPSVIVRPGYGSDGQSRGAGATKAVVLGSADYEDYVTEDASEVLLARTARPGSKRHQLAGV